MRISPVEAERLTEAEQVLRDLASQMISFAETETVAVWALNNIGFDLAKAGRGLIGLSNTIDTYGNATHSTYGAPKKHYCLDVRESGASTLMWSNEERALGFRRAGRRLQFLLDGFGL